MSPDRPDLVALSLGAGVQSTTLALLAIEGVLPKPDVAIFADTGWEPRAVYDQLDKVTASLDAAGIPVHVVSAGNIRDDATSEDVPGVSLPLYIKGDRPDANERGGVIGRQCTSRFKLEPIMREVRVLLGATVTEFGCRRCEGTGRRIVPHSLHAGRTPREGVCSVCRGTGRGRRVGPAPKGKLAEQWVGFSTDEITRVAPARVSYLRSVFPLLDLDMSRKDCERFLAERGWSTTKSACIGCPFHGNAHWRDMRATAPDEWADAVAFDAAVRELPGHAASMDGARGFLHASRVPLAEAPIDHVTRREWADAQVDLFDAIADQAAEDGVANGCSPFGCRSDSPAGEWATNLEEDEPLEAVG